MQRKVRIMQAEAAPRGRGSGPSPLAGGSQARTLSINQELIPARPGKIFGIPASFLTLLPSRRQVLRIRK